MIKPDPNNARRHSDRNKEAIRASLKELGAGRSVVVDQDDVLIAGNGVYEQAQELGIPVRVIETDGAELVVVKRTDLAPDDQRRAALAIADNRTTDLSAWDDDALKDALVKLDDMAMFAGFDGKELAAMFKTEVTEDDAPEPPDEPTAKRGRVYTLGQHRVMCGDATDPEAIAQLVGGAKIDAIVTDPPYCSGGFQESGKAHGSKGTVTQANRDIRNDTISTRGFQVLLQSVISNCETRAIYIFIDWRMWVTLFDISEACGYGVRGMLVWDKGTPGMGIGWRHQHELVLFGTTGKVWPSDTKYRAAQGDVIAADRTGNLNHATEKPVSLISVILETSTWAETMIDPFLGSGTTLIAAEQLGRTCYGIEIEPRYVDVAIQRWCNLTDNDFDEIMEAPE